MKTVAIISEYNPFHKGHAAHLDMIRKAYGDDVAIIAIMSGNYTQRGELAVADAFVRAKAAVRSGVQLVLKLPFPFSTASAEYFAMAGVSIAEGLGVTDVLSFGSECGDLTQLSRVAENLSSPIYKAHMYEHADATHASLGHARKAELLYRKLFGDTDASLLSSPNNTLGIEYLRALNFIGSTIEPHTVKREGSYHENELIPDIYPSATAIRNSWRAAAYEEGFLFLPEASANVFRQELTSGTFPIDQNELSTVVLAHFRNILTHPSTTLPAEDGGGLYARLCRLSHKATDLQNLIELSKTKKYTTARIRRLIWYALFGVTSSDLCAKPKYTQLLAMDDRGAKLLRRIHRQGTIDILTKPADYHCMSEEAVYQAEKDIRADQLFLLARNVALRNDSPFLRTPYRMKDE